MKQYYITSLYSQNMQVSVQQDHANKVLFRELIKDQNSEEFKIFNDYINNHETTVCLGVSQPMEILKIYSFMYQHKDKLKLPMAIFKEPSLNDTVTALTFVTNTKLSYPIMNEIRYIFKENRIDYYNISKEQTVTNRSGSMSIHITLDKNNHPVFNIDFTRTRFSSAQNEFVMPKDLTPDVLSSLYKSLNVDDYNFHNNCNTYIEKTKETINVNYCLEELVFLDMISQLRLKN